MNITRLGHFCYSDSDGSNEMVCEVAMVLAVSGDTVDIDVTNKNGSRRFRSGVPVNGFGHIEPGDKPSFHLSMDCPWNR